MEGSMEMILNGTDLSFVVSLIAGARAAAHLVEAFIHGWRSGRLEAC
jgi:hypothetical protein